VQVITNVSVEASDNFAMTAEDVAAAILQALGGDPAVDTIVAHVQHVSAPPEVVRESDDDTRE
jgi:hypothetical protein